MKTYIVIVYEVNKKKQGKGNGNYEKKRDI